jgi:hypothetical protein
MSEVIATPAATPALRFARGGPGRAGVAVLALTALADFLFYQQPGIGISAGLFIGFLGVGYFACLPHAGAPGRRLRAGLVLAASALPWVADAGWDQFLLSLAGCAIACGMLSVVPGEDVLRVAWRVVTGMGWRILPDVLRAAMAMRAARRGKWSPADAFIWVFPAGLGFVFLLLFAAANPIIGNVVSMSNWQDVYDVMFSQRVWFWAAVAALLWPFLMPVVLRPRRVLAAPAPGMGIGGVLLGRAAVLRSLIVFNALFAMQTVMDVDYLWLGQALPAGLSYADYAHQGAYPLIMTALLAGVFTIFATRPGSAAAASRLIRWLVLGWILQNVLLVFSSILRLKLYVDAYELTALRLAAFVWMGLVAVGLILIFVRIRLRLSNGWLLRANAVALGVTLYGCSFGNFANLVSMYDVKHCLEVSGRGQALDVDYLGTLGPQAIPALDYYQVHTVKPATGRPFAFLSRGVVGQTRDNLAASFLAEAPGWRGWNVWRWHLGTYLRTHAP